MKKNLGSTKLTGWKMLVVASMLMMATFSANAQHHHHHGPPPPPVNFDSIIVTHIDSFLAHFPIDSFWGHFTFDTIPFNHDTGGGGHHFHDSIPHPSDTGWFGGGHHDHDTITFHFPPFPIDSNWFGGGHGHDTIPFPFPPDTGFGGGHHHDTIPCPHDTGWNGGGVNPDSGWFGGGGTWPPFPPDSGWFGGGGPPPPFDSTWIHHKDLLVGTDNTPASISIFPNPVVSTSTMRIQNTSNTVTFRLYDMSGRVAREMINVSNGDMNFEKGNLTPGVYIYEMIDGNTIASTGKVLVQ